jgi:glucose-6-phosphate dehydrogenase assembly protein OpcA
MTEKSVNNTSSNGAQKSQGGTGLASYEDVIIRGEARAVELESIEKAITALWQTAAKTKDDGDTDPAQTPVMRACVLNFVIYTESEQGLEEATEMVARLTWSYPCRAIVLVARPDVPPDDLDAWISAHCQLPDPKGSKVCCEQITVEGSSQNQESLASLVLPLLVPDLPVVVWWPGDPVLDGPFFERLMNATDRLIVDSRRFSDPVRSFKRLAELSESGYRGVTFSDLNWARLTHWRRISAQFFDAPEMLPYLQRIDKLTIDYEAPDGQHEPNFSEALLLIGWLGNQLGWKPAFSLQRDGKNASLMINSGGRPLPIEFIGHNERHDEEGGITGIKIQASIPGEGRSATFSLELCQDFEHAEVVTEEQDKPARSRIVGLPKRDETDLLGEDLAVIKHDRMYELSLAMASQLAD